MSRTATADELTRVHMSLVALMAEGRRDDARALLKTLDVETEAAMWARGLFDTLLLATALAATLGVEDVPGWLRDFGRSDEEPS
ncbi:hypothetical protein [Gordonia sp. WA4-43]|uniref:hypothetical protein n=1 Tax=Gordonia sp. WA4-43 TaxID=2878678 RepID=UPI001CF9C752|nr:hypothetical protein [Gordonia sp. WA4-43]UCZ89857.1 hypothetical protein LEL84_23115 [Gordonia sp. WA4-43]